MLTIPELSTFIVDLTTSWTNQSVLPTSTALEPDTMRRVRQPILFYDATQNVIRRYGGWPYDAPNGALPDDMPSELWSFPAGTKDSNWVVDTSPIANGLSSSSPGPFAPAIAFSESAFYAFGGNVFKPAALPNMTVLSGVVTQDFSSQRWDNVTTNIPNQSQYRTQAKSVFVPNFGDKGFIVTVGGESPETEESFYEEAKFMTDMSTITLYDIASDTWYTQTATGEIPPPRSEFCAVGVNSSDGSSFEMFVYGGSTNVTYDQNHPGEAGYLSVYALSIPAFKWFRSESRTPVRRACHTCSIIGKRQMVSVGGRLPSTSMTLGQERDPWITGLGIFDMSEFTWAESYRADAAPYEQPKIVKDHYASSYQEPIWSNAALASIFAYTAPPPSPDSTNSGSNSTSTGSTSGSSSTTTPNNEPTVEKKSSVGPIVGGVIAGVVGLAIVLGVGFMIGRKRRARQKSSAAEVAAEEHQPPPVYRSMTEHAAETGIYEAPASKPRQELPDTPRHKQSHFVELPVSSRD
ncbi:hypothetical protein LTR84_010799 [Exophiala bonariae]|uniref:Kelch repeat protein n=1 Tax=Exophiala bonariae TaxID=1690606 RepID=A0AAV9NHU1_9EURO|nr:hypothetical protein LTR84_010799 [Exophiala bonariae]